VRGVHVAFATPNDPNDPPRAVLITGPDYDDSDATGPSKPEIAHAIEAWMQGAHDQPLHIVWWTIPPDVFACAGLAVAIAIVLMIAARSRVRASTDGSLLHLESRHAFGERRATFARNEIRAVSVESRMLGPFSFARPIVVTRGGGKVPIGPLALSDVAAAELATRIRALLQM
jgi:hypothetical protein